MARLKAKEFKEKYNILAKYKCGRCKKEWEGVPLQGYSPCCGSMFYDWLNYEEVLDIIHKDCIDKHIC